MIKVPKCNRMQVSQLISLLEVGEMEHHSLDIEVRHSENFSGFTLAQNLLQPAL